MGESLEHFEKNAVPEALKVVPEAHEEGTDYERYRELGGIINEGDYRSIRQRAENLAVLPKEVELELRAQAKLIATEAGIARLDERVIRLYGVMRNDTKPKDVEYHHSQMSDQPLFAEALRMAGDKDSLDALISKHPNIWEKQKLPGDSGDAEHGTLPDPRTLH